MFFWSKYPRNYLFCNFFIFQLETQRRFSDEFENAKQNFPRFVT